MADAKWFCGDSKTDDIIKRLPDEIWDMARNEVLDSGNQGIWTMCKVAIDYLIEFWKDENGGDRDG